MAESQRLEAKGLRLCARIKTFDALPGSSRLLSRVQSELVDLRCDPSASRLAGAANNLAAIDWELDVCAWAPEPVALSHSTAGDCTGPPIPIDVVAAGGAWWLEAKATLPFGLGSTAWVDLTHQVARLMARARSSLSGAHRPRVLVLFRHACPEEVHEALDALGVVAVCASADGSLPEPTAIASLSEAEAALLRPPPLLLDVSTLICLLSSTCRARPDEAALCAWAAPNEHWRRSLAEEARTPLLPRLGGLLRRHAPWLARATELERCDALVAMAGGAAERARWTALRKALVVVDCPTAAEARGSTARSPAALVSATEARAVADGLDELQRSLGALSEAHRRLLLDSAAMGALLCTANGRLVRRVPENVHLRTHVHQVRWLVGDAIPLSDKERARLEAEPESVLEFE